MVLESTYRVPTVHEVVIVLVNGVVSRLGMSRMHGFWNRLIVFPRFMRLLSYSQNGVELTGNESNAWVLKPTYRVYTIDNVVIVFVNKIAS